MEREVEAIMNRTSALDELYKLAQQLPFSATVKLSRSTLSAETRLLHVHLEDNDHEVRVLFIIDEFVVYLSDNHGEHVETSVVSTKKEVCDQVKLWNERLKRWSALPISFKKPETQT